jgi:transcriptional regulator with GAF, ATPase, and Fis domain
MPQSDGEPSPYSYVHLPAWLRPNPDTSSYARTHSGSGTRQVLAWSSNLAGTPHSRLAPKARGYNVVVPRVKDLELRLQRTEQQLRLFQKISRFMVAEMSLQEVLRGVVSLIVEFTQCDSCLVYLLDNDQLVLCASNTPHPSTIGKVRLRLNEGLTGWVARERRLLAIPREAYKDPRFKVFGELPEDTFEAFLSAPVIARNRVVGVINVQHRLPHQHTGGEMEVLTTVGEQVGCVLVLARMAPTAVESANHVELVLASGPVSMK